MTPAKQPLCPLCGEPNACAPVACGRFDVRCWCQDVVIAPAALARLPSDQRDKACLCRRCAAGDGDGEGEGEGQQSSARKA